VPVKKSDRNSSLWSREINGRKYDFELRFKKNANAELTVIRPIPGIEKMSRAQIKKLIAEFDEDLVSL